MNLFSIIKGRISIFDVIQEYTVLKKAGSYWKGHCPFHNEKTASFTVSPHKEIFYCFGCHLGGDVITFISNVEHCSQLEAAHFLIDRYQLELPESFSYSHADADAKKKYGQLCYHVSQWCSQSLIKSGAAQTYLRERGIHKQSIEKFSIGYFPGGLASIKNFIHYMRSVHFLPNDLIQANILCQGKTVLYSPFEERIIFPIKDQLGRYCGFGGRIFKPNDERAKYYNSKENDFFNKGSLLFGFDSAKKGIQEQGYVFLVEGYMDALMMVQHFYENTVATLGTACTLEHLKILSRHAKKIIVLYDADKAGFNAILRLAELCWQVSLDLSVLSLPAQEDPASFLAKNMNLKPLIETAQDIFDFYIQSLSLHFESKSLGEKLEIARKILDIIARIDDPIKRDILLKKTAKALDIPFQSLFQQLPENNVRKAMDKPILKKPGRPTPKTEIPKLENKIFLAIMDNMQLFNENYEEYLITYLPTPLKEILIQLKNQIALDSALTFPQFFNILNEHDQYCVSKLMIESDEPSTSEEFSQLMVQLQKKNWKKIVLATKEKLHQARILGDEQKVALVLHEFLELKKIMVHKDLI